MGDSLSHLDDLLVYRASDHVGLEICARNLKEHKNAYGYITVTKFKIRREVLSLKCNCNSLKICGALWDNYAYLLGNFKASGHTSKPFKCKSTDMYIIPGENRTISSSLSSKQSWRRSDSTVGSSHRLFNGPGG